MDKSEMVKSFVEGDAMVILKTDGTTLQGRLAKIDLVQSRVVLKVAEYVGFDGKVELVDLEEIGFDSIDTISKPLTVVQKPPTLDDDLRKYPIGKYLMIWGKHDGSINSTIQQGQLKSINWGNRTLVLHNTNYNEDLTVKMDQISFIDDTRSGSGAKSSVQTPDWHMRPDGAWYRGDRKYGGD